MTRAVPAGIAAVVVAIAAVVLFQLRPDHASATADSDVAAAVPAGAVSADAAAGPTGAFSLERTEQHARAATKQRPADAQAHHYLALALHAQGRLNDAAAEYRAALRIDPGYQPAADALRHVEAQLAGDPRASVAE